MKKIVIAAILIAGLSGAAGARGWEDGGWMNGWCHGDLATRFPVPFGLAC